MSIKIEMPPSLSGRSEDQVKQLYGYLYRLSENLNVALNAMEQHPETAQKAVARGTTPTAAKQNKTDSEADYGGTYNELRALIMNTANTVRKEIAEVETTPVLRIDSSRGTVFKNNQVETVLTVTVYTGQHRITDIKELKRIYGDSAHLEWKWQKMGETTFGTILSNDSRLSDDGFTFTLTPEDVDTKVTFMCQLVT